MAPGGSLFVVSGQSGELTRAEGRPGRYDLVLTMPQGLAGTVEVLSRRLRKPALT